VVSLCIRASRRRPTPTSCSRRSGGTTSSVHHPFDSFASSFEAFLLAASRDPAVVALKTALYRTSEDSPVVPALVERQNGGSRGVSLIELKARFDEYRNRLVALARAGRRPCRLRIPESQDSRQATLVVRREGDELRRYVHLGTGNYNISGPHLRGLRAFHGRSRDRG